MRLLLLSIIGTFLFVTDVHASQQWIQRADYGNFGRHRATMMAIGNKVYAGTGHLNGDGSDEWYKDWWEYDPATNAWGQKADYPGNNGNGDQDIVSIGFDDVGYAGMGWIDGDSFYRFDPQLNLWTQIPAPPGSYNFNNTFPFRIGSKGYFPTLFSTAFFEFDSSNETWTQLNPLPFSGNYGIPTFAIGEKGYIKNGTAFYEYKPSVDSWTPRASFPGTYTFRPRGIHQNGYGFIIGGAQASFTAWGNEVWRYDPATDSWLQMPDFPGATRRWASVCNLNGRVYYGLGTSGTNFNDFWEFNSVGGFEEFDLSSFKAYPTPAVDHVTFSSEDHPDFTIEVYDLQGRSVGSTKAANGKAVFERGNAIAGTYIYNVLIDGSVVHYDKIIFR